MVLQNSGTITSGRCFNERIQFDFQINTNISGLFPYFLSTHSAKVIADMHNVLKNIRTGMPTQTLSRKHTRTHTHERT